MRELASKDKASLIILLEKHYTIKEKNFINAIASNEEEKQTLTLIAYAVGAEQREPQADVTTLPNLCSTIDVSTVVINELCSKILFVKAIKEVKNTGLKEAKDIAESLLMIKSLCSVPFLVGDSLDCQFSAKQWTQICSMLGNDIDWKYV